MFCLSLFLACPNKAPPYNKKGDPNNPKNESQIKGMGEVSKLRIFCKDFGHAQPARKKRIAKATLYAIKKHILLSGHFLATFYTFPTFFGTLLTYFAIELGTFICAGFTKVSANVAYTFRVFRLACQ